MPDTLNATSGDPNPVDPQIFAKWVQQAQEKLAAGGTLRPNEIPTGYKVEGNQLVQDTELGSSLWKGAALTGLAAFGGLALPAAGAVGAGTGLGAAGAGIGASGAGGAAAGAGAGGLTGALAGAASGLLPSTQIGTGSITAPSSTSSMLASPGASFGLPDWLKTAQNVGSALSSASAGRASGRVAEGIQNQNQNRTAVDLYNSELAAPGKIAHNAVKGDILSNAQDVSIDAPSTIPVPKISGGLRPSMFSPETRATGVGLRSNALASAANLKPAMAPVLPELPQAGTLDSILNSGSAVANIAGSVPWDKIPWGKIAGAFGG